MTCIHLVYNFKMKRSTLIIMVRAVVYIRLTIITLINMRIRHDKSFDVNFRLIGLMNRPISHY